MSDEWPLSSEIFRSDELPLQGGSLFLVGNCGCTPFLMVNCRTVCPFRNRYK